MKTGLTSFRAFAFLAVFLFHLSVFGIGPQNVGFLGVQAFFVLSGFLLTPILIEMKANLNFRDYFVNFYGRRALRIFPLYYFYLLVVAGLSLLVLDREGYRGITEMERFLDQLPWTLTYTFNFFHASSLYEYTCLTTHFWSLAVEEQFYLIWPFLLFFTPKRHLKKLLLVLIIAGPVVRFLIFAIFKADMLPIFHQRLDVVVYVLPFSHIDAFAIGGFFALFQKSKKSWSTWLVILAAISLGFISDSFNAVDRNSPFCLGYAPFMKDSYKFIWGYSILNLMFAFILIQVRDGKFVPALLDNAILEYLGKISYGLYVFHFPVIWLVFKLLSGSSGFILVSVSLAVTIIISALSYEFVEKRFISMKGKYFPKKQPAIR
ncbi:MAG: acyltransferase [Gemmatimonadales bacterium]|nr:acyltransferase [Gemmatimonadales bacterium]